MTRHIVAAGAAFVLIAGANYYLRTALEGVPWSWWNAAAIAVALGTASTLFRSLVFGVTFAMCVGFGTWASDAYRPSDGATISIVVVTTILLLFTATHVVLGTRPRALWPAATAVMFGAAMMGFAAWFDLLIVIWACVPLVYVGLRRLGCLDEAARFARLAQVILAAGVVYFIVRVMRAGMSAGSETIFGYTSAWPMIDDAISSTIAHTYLSVATFLPTPLAGASGLYRLGAEGLMGAPAPVDPFQYLVPMHHVFFWRYYAGAAFVIVGYAIYRAAWRMWRRPTGWTLALMVFLMMILVPGAGQVVSRFQPPDALPTATPAGMAGVLGAALLIAWLTTSAWRTSRNRRGALGVVIVVWAVLIHGALSRPAYLSYAAAQTTVRDQPHPNPMKTLVEKLGGSYRDPGGLVAYRLMPRHDEIAAARMLLGDLPQPLPSAEQWSSAAAESSITAAAAGGIEFAGDATQFGYQLMSPLVDVQPGATYLFRVKFAALEGLVCAGILTGDQQRWLAPPDGTTVEYRVQPTSSSIRVVIANCYPGDAGNPKSRFALTGGSFGIVTGAQPR